MPLFRKKKRCSPDSDLQKIGRNDPSVAEVGWSWKDIRDDQVVKLVEALRDNTHVTKLYLMDNKITHVSVKTLAEMLEINATVTKLFLNGNKITDVGAKALADRLRINETLITLKLGSSDITDVGAKALVEMLHWNATITYLYLGNNAISHDLRQKVNQLLKINGEASSPHDAFGRKLKLAVDSDRGSSEGALSLALVGLKRFPESDYFKDLASSVDLATGRDLYELAAKHSAGAALAHLLRAHPSLCEHRDEKEQGGLYPFMLLATMPTAGVSDVLEVLLMKPDMVASGIC